MWVLFPLPEGTSASPFNFSRRMNRKQQVIHVIRLHPEDFKTSFNKVVIINILK